jgi:hypothetical protein
MAMNRKKSGSKKSRRTSDDLFTPKDIELLYRRVLRELLAASRWADAKGMPASGAITAALEFSVGLLTLTEDTDQLADVLEELADAVRKGEELTTGWVVRRLGD